MLSPKQVMDHAQGVIAASHRAAYDAAIVQQLSERLRMSPGAVAAMARKQREGREPLDPAATAPLVLEPQVAGRTGEPRVRVSVDLRRVGDWSVAEADAYARTMLAAQQRAEDETVYRQLLMATVGMTDWQAQNAVADLSTFHRF